MTITREQVADLREGDIVEYHRDDWPEGTVLRGPLHRRDDSLFLASFVIRLGNDCPPPRAGCEESTLTVVSRVPRLYVNHDRTHPVPGDVVRDESSQLAHTWHYLGDPELGGRWWRFDDLRIPFDKGARLRLLVDGENGNAVPS